MLGIGPQAPGLEESIPGMCGGYRFGVRLAGVNYFFRRRQLLLPVLSLHHWPTIAQSDAKGVRSSGSEISARLRS